MKDLADVVGIRENALFGYGLVVGLAGSGDSDKVVFTTLSMASLLGRMGIRVDPKQIQARNVAAVMVTARLPPFARPGTRIDVAVSSLGNARSLAGGMLLLTSLTGGDGRVYASGQGPVQVAGFDAGGGGASATKNTPTSGRVASGATVERIVDYTLGTGPLTLSLRRPDLTNASRIAAAVNERLGAGTARALDPAAVELTLSEESKRDTVGFLAQIEAVEVQADRRARVVVSERTGVLVAGEGVRLWPVAVAHGGLNVHVQRDPVVPPPGAAGQAVTAAQATGAAAQATGAAAQTTGAAAQTTGAAAQTAGTAAQTTVTAVQATGTAAQTTVTADEVTGHAVALGATATVEDLARALNALGASPRDLIAVLEAIKAAGALDGELEVLQ